MISSVICVGIVILLIVVLVLASASTARHRSPPRRFRECRVPLFGYLRESHGKSIASIGSAMLTSRSLERPNLAVGLACWYAPLASQGSSRLLSFLRKGASTSHGGLGSQGLAFCDAALSSKSNVPSSCSPALAPPVLVLLFRRQNCCRLTDVPGTSLCGDFHDCGGKFLMEPPCIPGKLHFQEGAGSAAEKLSSRPGPVVPTALPLQAPRHIRGHRAILGLVPALRCT